MFKNKLDKNLKGRVVNRIKGGGKINRPFDCRFKGDGRDWISLIVFCGPFRAESNPESFRSQGDTGFNLAAFAGDLDREPLLL